MWKNRRRSYKNNKFKILASTWNEEFELPDGSYSIPDIADYFEYILKMHGEKTVNISIKKYIGKIEKRITFKIFVNDNYQWSWESCIYLFLIHRLVNY